jgi:hypothetical protein
MEIPALALIHPEDPDLVYFFLEKLLFGVDLRARKVVDCNGCVAEMSRRQLLSSAHGSFPQPLPSVTLIIIVRVRFLLTLGFVLVFSCFPYVSCLHKYSICICQVNNLNYQLTN